MTQQKEHSGVDTDGFDRRKFLQVAGATAVAAGVTPGIVSAQEKKSAEGPEKFVAQLYEKLTPRQKKTICFDWDHQDSRKGLLRTRVEANWHITSPKIAGDFYTKDQKELIRAIFEGLYNPEWVSKIDKQLKDDSNGYGKEQNIAIFGKPGAEKFEFVMTGRHLTIRCDGNSTKNVAFGGPIFYGHAAESDNEKADHPGNVFWEQAVVANKVYEMLDGKQRELALIPKRPRENKVGFRKKGAERPGIVISDLADDQKKEVQKVLAKLIEPYRKADQKEVVECLEKQGGLEKCSLAFYEQGDIGDDGVWDNWRLEGPSFVWHYRGSPHVHVWVNVASDPSIKLNA